ncbi:MAG: A/G-specific adenine glycosylase [Bacteroidales bacterium]|nr:A/G-specific adenine glycosylase [Bacteroidales bacterium]
MIPFSKTLLAWYGDHGRDLPWRRTRDPYAIWLSEIILQQTRIAQGQAYWERFMERFPDVQALAGATEDEVLRLWQGLGYYSRARNLHAAAKQIAAQGRFPDTLEGIRALKGVGDYTAAAIGSIAFGLPAAVVDGNVYRVLARHYGISTPVGSAAAKKEFTALAQSLLPPEQPGDFNQAMMDFGAVQCTPASPACLLCPLADSCAALATGSVDRLPVKEKGPAVSTRRFDYIYLRCQGRTAIRKRGPGDIWEGLYEPIVCDNRSEAAEGVPGDSSPAAATAADGPEQPRLLRSVRHQLTHRTLLVDFYLWEPQQEPVLPEGYFWISEAELDRYAKPRLFELLLEEIPK